MVALTATHSHNNAPRWYHGVSSRACPCEGGGARPRRCGSPQPGPRPPVRRPEPAPAKAGAELTDAAVDAGGSQLEAKPIVQELLDLLTRQPEAYRQDGDEAGECRADQAAFGQLQVAPAALDLRAAAGAGTGDGFVAARAAAGEIAVFGSADLQSHGRSFEIVDVVRAVLPTALRGAERGTACHAGGCIVIDSVADDHRLTPPEAGHSRPFAGWLRRLLVGCPGLGCAGWWRAGIAAARVALVVRFIVPGLPALVAAPVRIVARRRTRAVRRVLLHLVGQGPRDLDQLPRQFLQLVSGQCPEPFAVHVV